MSRRVLRRHAVLGLLAALAAALSAEPAHAFTDFAADRPDRPRAAAAATEAPPVGARALAAARTRIGAAYAMGAAGPSAFDCSGLTLWAFARAGVALAHSSFAQFGAGHAVAREDVRAGDPVFFRTSGPGASHVGIATGRGTAVSATSSGVAEHPLDDAYWGAAYVGARRLG